MLLCEQNECVHIEAKLGQEHLLGNGWCDQVLGAMKRKVHHI